MKRAILLGIVMSLAVPAVAAAKLVVNHGMFGVTLGSSPAQVRAKLGKPNSIVHISGDAEWVYVRDRVVVLFKGSRPSVGSLFTRNRSERTAGGIGVGSTRQQVQKAFPGANCTHSGCIVLSQLAGKTYGTDFGLDGSGRVSSILVSQLS